MKPWYTSKTLIINALAAALATLEASTGILKPVLGNGGLYVALAVGLPVVNAVLRAVTTEALTSKKTNEADARTEESGT